MHAPERDQQTGRHGLEQGRNEDRELAEPDPEAAQMGAAILIELAYLIADVPAVEDTGILDKLKADAPCKARERGHAADDLIGGDRRIVSARVRIDRFTQIEKRRQDPGDMRRHPFGEAGLERFPLGRLQVPVAHDHNLWRQAIRARSKAGDRIPLPPQTAMVGKFDGRVRRADELGRPGPDHGAQGLGRRRTQRLAVEAAGAGIGHELEALELADIVPLDRHLAFRRDLGYEIILELKAAHQMAGALVDEALGQALMEGIGELVLDRARPFLPMVGIVEPLGPVGHEGPGAHMGDPHGQSVDIPFRAVQPVQMPGQPIRRQTIVVIQQVLVDGGQQDNMFLKGHVPEIRDLTHAPQPLQVGTTLEGFADHHVFGHPSERQIVARDPRPRQSLDRRRHFKALDQGLEGSEIQVPIAPLHDAHGIEAVGFDLFHEIGIEIRGVARRAEGPVIEIAPGPPGDLTDFMGPQGADG